MKTKKELMYELDKVTKDRDQYKRFHEHDLAHIKWLDQILDDKQKELEEFKDKYATAIWDMGDYVAFYEKIKSFVEAIEEENGKPKVIPVDLTKQPDPVLVDYCKFVADSFAGDKDG